MAERHGIDQESGAALEGYDHLRQSLLDILFTPLGTRVLRRDYGSLLPRLIDAPMNDIVIVDAFASAASAIDKWEPSYDLVSMSIDNASAGQMQFGMTGLWYPDWPDTKRVETRDFVFEVFA